MARGGRLRLAIAWLAPAYRDESRQNSRVLGPALPRWRLGGWLSKRVGRALSPPSGLGALTGDADCLPPQLTLILELAATVGPKTLGQSNSGARHGQVPGSRRFRRSGSRQSGSPRAWLRPSIFDGARCGSLAPRGHRPSALADFERPGSALSSTVPGWRSSVGTARSRRPICPARRRCRSAPCLRKHRRQRARFSLPPALGPTGPRSPLES